MTQATGPLYEVTVTVDRDIEEEYDAWLRSHVEVSLQAPGITGIEVFEQHDDEAGSVRRITQYRFASDADLDRYLAEDAKALQKSVPFALQGGLQKSARMLRHAAVVDRQVPPQQDCLNCGTPLTGQYCGNCGQRAATRLISIWELIRDAFGDLLDLDSRLWRTLVPLAIRPGRLTRDYLQGRRARFMPPFRMYLVLSIVFFLLAFFDPREELGVLFEPPSTSEDSADATPDNDTADARSGIVLSIDGEQDDDCDFSDYDSADVPAWLASRLTRERLTVMCNRIAADDGKAFLRKLSDNVPAALFVLLPLMALVLKLLYPLSKRYYVEHLLFVVHYHAFVFLVLSLQILMSRVGTWLHVPELPLGGISFALSMYVPVYLYKAQRHVYEQGRLITLLKFLMLTLAYFSGLFVIFAAVAIFAAFSF